MKLQSLNSRLSDGKDDRLINLLLDPVRQINPTLVMDQQKPIETLRRLEDTLSPFSNKREINALFDQALKQCPDILSSLGTELGPQRQLSKLTSILQNANPDTNRELLNVVLNALGQSTPSLVSVVQKNPRVLKQIADELDPLKDRDAIQYALSACDQCRPTLIQSTS